MIVSPLLVSYLLSQVALRRELATVFEALSRPWGAQIVFRPAREYLAAGDTATDTFAFRVSTARPISFCVSSRRTTIFLISGSVIWFHRSL